MMNISASIRSMLLESMERFREDPAELNQLNLECSLQQYLKFESVKR